MTMDGCKFSINIYGTAERTAILLTHRESFYPTTIEAVSGARWWSETHPA